MVKIPREYRLYCRQLRHRFNKLGRGSRARCSWDIKVAPATISRILAGKYKSWKTLEKMVQWADEQEKNRSL